MLKNDIIEKQNKETSLEESINILLKHTRNIFPNDLFTKIDIGGDPKYNSKDDYYLEELDDKKIINYIGKYFVEKTKNLEDIKILLTKNLLDIYSLLNIDQKYTSQNLEKQIKIKDDELKFLFFYDNKPFSYGVITIVEQIESYDFIFTLREAYPLNIYFENEKTNLQKDLNNIKFS